MTTGRPPSPSYLDYTGRDDILSGGVRLIPIDTPKGTFRVWTKRVGNAPTMRLLLLHGGPGATHEYFEAFDSYLPAAGIEYYYYDQLGSFYSDQPDEPDLWELPRFVDEVEQVRQALGLDRDSFFLLGHSWGGMLAIEYALQYQQHLKGLIISNMMASCPAYNAYAHDVLMPAMDQAVLAEIKGVRGGRRLREPALHGAADRAALRPSRAAHARGGVARPGQPGLQASSTRRSTSRCRGRASWV